MKRSSIVATARSISSWFCLISTCKENDVSNYKPEDDKHAPAGTLIGAGSLTSCLVSVSCCCSLASVAVSLSAMMLSGVSSRLPHLDCLADALYRSQCRSNTRSSCLQSLTVRHSVKVKVACLTPLTPPTGIKLKHREPPAALLVVGLLQPRQHPLNRTDPVRNVHLAPVHDVRTTRPLSARKETRLIRGLVKKLQQVHADCVSCCPSGPERD